MTDIYELGLLLKDINNFDMDTFDGRLRFQKTMHLLQSFGIGRGYRFTWYYHGMYCPALTKDGFELKNVIQKIPDITPKFQNGNDQISYDSFKEFMSDKKDNPDLLEIASTICFLHKEGMDKKRILLFTENKKAHFKREDCVQMWNELEKRGVIS